MDIADIYHDRDWEGRTYSYRGKIIAYFAMLEMTLDGFLANEFSVEGKNRRKMQQIVFDRMNFEAKRTALRAILLKRAEDQGFVKSKSNAHPYKGIIDELTELNTYRNMFAHFVTIQATNREEYSNAIGLMQNRDKETWHWFTTDQIDEIAKRINAAQREIIKLNKIKKI